MDLFMEMGLAAVSPYIPEAEESELKSAIAERILKNPGLAKVWMQGEDCDEPSSLAEFCKALEAHHFQRPGAIRAWKFAQYAEKEIEVQHDSDYVVVLEMRS